MKGYVQVYTGNGKGKTTCMLGLALRAAGAGKKVYIGQFLKDDEYSEIKALRTYLPQIEVEQFGAGKGFIKKGNASKEDIQCAKEGYRKGYEAATSGAYDVVILDEINVAMYYELVTKEEAFALMDAKAEHTELILTGRYAEEAVIEKADLVTEMTEIKHYYKAGVDARVGIEK